jgi:acyl transferase domain-containing protein
MDTVVAQPALGAVEKGLCDLLRRLGVRPDMTAGHSYVRSALSVAEAFSDDVLFAVSKAAAKLSRWRQATTPGRWPLCRGIRGRDAAARAAA